MAEIQSQVNKVVVAFLDKRRLKGYVFNFSALRESFRLYPEPTSRQGEGTDVLIKELKAVFFVKDFVGNPDYHESYDVNPTAHGRKIEVQFGDTETIVGLTEAYNPQKIGFFVFPADPNSNNLRIFVVNKNTCKIRIL